MPSHVPVLPGAVRSLLAPAPFAGWIVDGTVGAGGHAASLLAAAGPEARLLALDRDETALAIARETLAPFAGRVSFVHAPFSRMADAAREAGVSSVRAVLLDLGVSSMQLDRAERGFSFLRDGPLDMRMDATGGGRTAYGILRDESEEALAAIFREYGEERFAARAARAVKTALAEGRLPDSTAALADLLGKALGGRKGHLHPATRCFQALRLAVNRELDELERVLPQALDLLAPGGRLGVISFHSLEDRIVKNFFRLHEGETVSLPQGGTRWAGAEPRGERATRKPVVPDEAECAANPRARSAKLRVFEKAREGAA
jgi:16S rRNA (cytosine1402-N4)-methyltransferase